jgi:hypothetical protein
MDDAGLVRRFEGSAICRASGSASSIGIAPRAIRSDRSSPSTNSMTIARPPASILSIA